MPVTKPVEIKVSHVTNLMEAVLSSSRMRLVSVTA